MNIMLVSVTERTREIGLRMAVGARGKDIQLQFLIEALTMACAGGVVGIVVGTAASLIASWASHWPTVITVFSILLGFVSSALTGVIFGYYPAQRARGSRPRSRPSATNDRRTRTAAYSIRWLSSWAKLSPKMISRAKLRKPWGKPSSMALTSSSRFFCSGLNVTARTPRLSFNWSKVRAPKIGTMTPGCCRIHAIAAWLVVTPSSLATASVSLAIAKNF